MIAADFEGKLKLKKYPVRASNHTIKSTSVYLMRKRITSGHKMCLIWRHIYKILSHFSHELKCNLLLKMNVEKTPKTLEDHPRVRENWHNNTKKKSTIREIQI